MSDIIEQLREIPDEITLRLSAANEIERLRADIAIMDVENQRLRVALEYEKKEATAARLMVETVLSRELSRSLGLDSNDARWGILLSAIEKAEKLT